MLFNRVLAVCLSVGNPLRCGSAFRAKGWEMLESLGQRSAGLARQCLGGERLGVLLFVAQRPEARRCCWLSAAGGVAGRVSTAFRGRRQAPPRPSSLGVYISPSISQKISIKS